MNKNAPLLKPEDMVGKHIAMAEEKSLASKVGYATLRDMGMNPAKQDIHYARLQEAVAFMVDTSDAGQKMLAKIGIKGFTAGDPQEYVDFLKWIGA